MKVAGIIILGTIATPLVAFYLIAPSIFVTTTVWAMFLGGLAGIGVGCRRIYLSWAPGKPTRAEAPVPLRGSTAQARQATVPTSSADDR